ncbi:NUDIX domain-containing protein [Streptomyces sp. BBFR2]|uniref:NUDIX domain-containing protein n=1 Tax=Streptomyces sp. BBFR2 TaxID=3372854 RepID=UPI0037DA5EFD
MTHAISASAVTREMTNYLRKHPSEEGKLRPLYDALSDHSRRGLCPHGGRCPEIVSGALLLNEHGHVLLLRNSIAGGWAFAEGAPEPGDLSLRDTAYALLMEYGGVQEAWALPGAEGPVIVDVSTGPRRVRFGFRYLFVTQNSSVSSAVLDSGLARWVTLDRIADHIATRIRDHAAVPL